MLAAFAFGSTGIAGIFESVGPIFAVVALFRLASKELVFEPAVFGTELFDFLFELLDSLLAAAKATFPIAYLLAEFEILTL